MDRLGMHYRIRCVFLGTESHTDLQHQLWMITLRDELVLAPTKKLDKVLDIGTGTGIVCSMSLLVWHTAGVQSSTGSSVQSFKDKNRLSRQSSETSADFLVVGYRVW